MFDIQIPPDVSDHVYSVESGTVTTVPTADFGRPELVMVMLAAAAAGPD